MILNGSIQFRDRGYVSDLTGEGNKVGMDAI